MTDTNRDGSSTLHHDSDTPVNSDFNSGSCDPTTNKLAVQMRTRSQLDVPDLILRLPLSRSPLKDAKKARAKAQATSPVSQEDLQLPTVDHEELLAGPNVVTERGPQEAVHMSEEEVQMDTWMEERAQQHEEEEGSEDSLFSPASQGHDAKGRDEDLRQHTMQWPVSTKKRTSPDTEAMRALASADSERQPKRAKVEAFRILACRQEHTEYHEPLRDPDASTPGRPKGYKRTSSTETSSPSKVASIFHRAQSVPLGGENDVCAIDLTSIPPSPRRSPCKGAVEIRRALSVPPGDDRMDVDAGDNSGLLYYTNPTQSITPRPNPVFRYTVNFATPRGSATPPRSGTHSASPLSPLTPLPPSPFTKRLPEIRGLLAKAKVKLLKLSDRMDTYTSPPTDSVAVPRAADKDISSQPSSAASTSRPGTAASGSAIASQSRLPRPPLISSQPAEVMPLPASAEENGSTMAVTIAGGVKGTPFDNLDDAGGTDASSELSSAPSSALSSQPDSNALPITRPTIIGAMKSKRGPSALYGPRRVTRSSSMKVQGLKGEGAKIEDTGDAAEMPVMIAVPATGTSSEPVALFPPTKVPSKPRPPKSTSAVSSKSKPLLATHRSTSSSSKYPPDLSKSRQTSLNTFIKTKPSTGGGGSSTVRTSTSSGSSLRVAPASSPSKIPLPASPLKRPSMAQSGNTHPFLSSLGSVNNGVGAGASHGLSGRSLTTLSHALDKLVVPPPSRPNTSLGFVRGEGSSGEESTSEKSKGKEKAKDDASIPGTSIARGSEATFARPTASSLNRAATVTGIGLTVATKILGQGGSTIGATGRGRGMIGIFGRVGDRASKKTSLPVVAGSPVKGSGGTGDQDSDGVGSGKHKSSLGSAKDAGGITGEDDVFVSQSAVTGSDLEQDAVMQDASSEAPKSGGGMVASRKSSPPVATSANNGVDINLTTPGSVDKGKQRALTSSTLNPASSALHALSESLSTLPQTPTPPKPKAVGTRSGLRSSTAAASKESPAIDGSGSVVPGSAVPGGNSEVHGSGPSNGTVDGSGGVKKSSLKILKQCAIFVDVRTEQGDDAGCVFVDMLKGLGAKILSRLGRRCTHIVYKNGLPNTLARYRMLSDPKPVVVGIAWVVECAEKRARVDEEKFKIDVDVINVAGGNQKRRRSMLPKHLIPASPGPEYETSMHMSSEADDDEGAGGIDGSPSQDLDLSIRSKEEDDLPPLERARRRRSILPGGQTRLVP